MKRWLSEDRFGWIVVSLALLMMLGQGVRFLFNYLWG